MNSSSTDSLSELSKKISLYGNIFIILVGNITNILKILFFFQYTFRTNSCSYYILAGTFADLFFLNNQPLIRLLRQLNLVGPMSSIECPIRSYFQTLSFSLSFTFLILAAFDRYCLTSRNSSHRKLSNPPLAFRLILLVTFIWIIFNTHHLFQHKLHNGICTTRFAHPYARPFMFSFFCIVPLLLIIFNILTFLNLRSMHHSLPSRINIQLTLLILCETTLTIISILPQTVFMAYFQMTSSTSRSAKRRSIENFIDTNLKLIAYSESTIGFIIYLLILSKLRRKFFRHICSCDKTIYLTIQMND